MQQAHKAMPVGDLFHDLHGQLVVVAGGVCVGVDRRHLMLRGGNLVVLGFGVDAQLPELLVELLHIRRDARADGAEVVVVQLLALGRLCTEERAAAHAKILALQIQRLVDQEVFLLGADLRHDLFRLRVAEQPQHAQRLPADSLHRAQQRRLFVQRFAGIRAEDGGDIQAVILDKGKRCGVPRGVASGLKRGAQAAGRERRCIRLAADELLAREIHDDAPAAGRGDEAVVFFGRVAGHGLEPVGKMRRAALERPGLHAVCDVVCDLQRKRLSVLQAAAPGIHCLPGHILRHGFLVEYTAAEQLRNTVGLFAHVSSSCLIFRFRRSC